MSYEDQEREYDQRRIPLEWLEDDKLHSSFKWVLKEVNWDDNNRVSSMVLEGHGLRKTIIFTRDPEGKITSTSVTIAQL